MEKETFSIPNISCGHCVMTIKNKLTAMEGVKAVEGNPEKKAFLWNGKLLPRVIK